MTLLRAYANYRSAVILLGKFGFTARDVWAMSHAEVASWVGSFLQSLGVKQTQDSGDHYHFVKKKKGA